MTVNESDEVQEEAQMSYADKIRANYDTEDLGAIMSRFYDAVKR